MAVQRQFFWGGIPVPYVALWSSEVGGYRIATDRHAGGRAALFTVGARGVGCPVWGVMNEQRQRQTVKTRCCQVCNVPLTSQRSFGMDIPENSRALPSLDFGPPRPVLREPPACTACTRYAIAHCPGSRRRYEAGVLECFEIFEYISVGTIVGRRKDGGAASPYLEEVLGPGETCIGMLKCLLTEFRRLTFAELSAEVAA